MGLHKRILELKKELGVPSDSGGGPAVDSELTIDSPSVWSREEKILAHSYPAAMANGSWSEAEYNQAKAEFDKVVDQLPHTLPAFCIPLQKHFLGVKSMGVDNTHTTLKGLLEQKEAAAAKILKAQQEEAATAASGAAPAAASDSNSENGESNVNGAIDDHHEFREDGGDDSEDGGGDSELDHRKPDGKQPASSKQQQKRNRSKRKSKKRNSRKSNSNKGNTRNTEESKSEDAEEEESDSEDEDEDEDGDEGEDEDEDGSDEDVNATVTDPNSNDEDDHKSDSTPPGTPANPKGKGKGKGRSPAAAAASSDQNSPSKLEEKEHQEAKAQYVESSMRNLTFVNVNFIKCLDEDNKIIPDSQLAAALKLSFEARHPTKSYNVDGALAGLVLATLPQNSKLHAPFEHLDLSETMRQHIEKLFAMCDKQCGTVVVLCTMAQWASIVSDTSLLAMYEFDPNPMIVIPSHDVASETSPNKSTDLIGGQGFVCLIGSHKNSHPTRYYGSDARGTSAFAAQSMYYSQYKAPTLCDLLRGPRWNQSEWIVFIAGQSTNDTLRKLFGFPHLEVGERVYPEFSAKFASMLAKKVHAELMQTKRQYVSGLLKQPVETLIKECNKVLPTIRNEYNGLSPEEKNEVNWLAFSKNDSKTEVDSPDDNTVGDSTASEPAKKYFRRPALRPSEKCPKFLRTLFRKFLPKQQNQSQLVIDAMAGACPTSLVAIDFPSVHLIMIDQDAYVLQKAEGRVRSILAERSKSMASTEKCQQLKQSELWRSFQPSAHGSLQQLDGRQVSSTAEAMLPPRTPRRTLHMYTCSSVLSTVSSSTYLDLPRLLPFRPFPESRLLCELWTSDSIESIG